jgi:hypothetical protein
MRSNERDGGDSHLLVENGSWVPAVGPLYSKELGVATAIALLPPFDELLEAGKHLRELAGAVARRYHARRTRRTSSS